MAELRINSFAVEGFCSYDNLGVGIAGLFRELS